MMEYELMAEEYEKYKKRKEFKDKLHLSTEYIDWLEKFTEEHEVFATDTFLYDEDKVTEEEKENISLLPVLFEVITEFADKNYISPKRDDFEMFYNIEYKGTGYEIGLNYGQGSSNYCVRQDEPEKDAISYENIMSGVKLLSTIQAESKLEELKELIEQLANDNVPVEAIHQATDTAIQKVKIKKERY